MKQEFFEEALPEFKAAYDARQMSVLLVNTRRCKSLGGLEAVAHGERFQAAESKPEPDTAKARSSIRPSVGHCSASRRPSRDRWVHLTSACRGDR